MEELTFSDFIDKLKKEKSLFNGKKQVVGIGMAQERKKIDDTRAYMHTYFTVTLADEKGKTETIRIDKE